MKRMQFTEIDVNLLKFGRKKFVTSNQVNLFLASSGHLEPLCGAVALLCGRHKTARITPETLARIEGLAVWAGCM